MMSQLLISAIDKYLGPNDSASVTPAIKGAMIALRGGLKTLVAACNDQALTEARAVEVCAFIAEWGKRFDELPAEAQAALILLKPTEGPFAELYKSVRECCALASPAPGPQPPPATPQSNGPPGGTPIPVPVPGTVTSLVPRGWTRGSDVVARLTPVSGDRHLASLDVVSGPVVLLPSEHSSLQDIAIELKCGTLAFPDCLCDPAVRPYLNWLVDVGRTRGLRMYRSILDLICCARPAPAPAPPAPLPVPVPVIDPPAPGPAPAPTPQPSPTPPIVIPVVNHCVLTGATPVGRMCRNSYEDEPNTEARIRRMLREARAHNVPRDKAVSYIALTGREAGWLVSLDRHPELPGTCECRTVVGSETVEEKVAGKGTGKWRWRKSSWSDAAFRTKAIELKVADANGYVINGARGPTRDVIGLFEWSLTTRNRPAMDSFSLGPSQQYLFYIGLRPHWPATIEEAESWYREFIHAGVWLTKVKYLDERTFPAKDMSRANCVRWLVNQTGNTALAEKYYDGEGQAIAYKNALALVVLYASTEWPV